MEFTKEEIGIIEKAEQYVKRAKRQQIMYMLLFLFFLIALFLTFLNLISFEEFSYIAIPLLFIAAIRPNLSKHLKYEVLVTILSSKKSKTEKSIDELTNAINFQK